MNKVYERRQSNMNKEKRIKQLRNKLNEYNDIKMQIERIESQEEVSFQQLREAFDYNNNTKVFTHKIVRKQYEFILGGDGRSSAWSEMRNGNVLVIKLSPNVYVSDSNKSKLKDYIRLAYEGPFDMIEIVG